MTKWHAHDVHMAKHTNMVVAPGPLGPPNPALHRVRTTATSTWEVKNFLR